MPRYGALLAAAVLACTHVPNASAYWRPSGWQPEERDDLAVGRQRCITRFIETAQLPIRHKGYRTRCVSAEAAVKYHFVTGVGMSEERCLEECYYRSGLPFGSGMQLPSNMTDWGFIIDRSTTAAFRPTDGKCMCGGLRDGPHGPPAIPSGGCEFYKLELPIACLFLSQDECGTVPSDSCIFDGHCCVDNLLPEQVRPPTEDSEEEKTLTIIALVVSALCVAMAICTVVLLCRYVARRRRQEADSEVRLRNRARRGGRRRRSGNIPTSDADLTFVAIALNGLQKSVLKSNPDRDNTDTSEPATETAATDAEATCLVCLESGDTPEEPLAVAEEGRLRVIARAVCGEELKEDDAGWLKLGCGHTMHYACTKKWFVEQARMGGPPSCPMCRTAVEVVSRPAKECVVRIPTGYVLLSYVSNDSRAPDAECDVEEQTLLTNVFPGDSPALLQGRVLSAFQQCCVRLPTLEAANDEVDVRGGINVDAFELDFSMAGKHEEEKKGGDPSLYDMIREGSSLTVVRKGRGSESVFKPKRGGGPDSPTSLQMSFRDNVTATSFHSVNSSAQLLRHNSSLAESRTDVHRFSDADVSIRINPLTGGSDEAASTTNEIV